MDEKLKQLMTALDLTEEEAKELLADDEKIDKGEKLFELTEEQKANSKKARLTGTRTQTTSTKRERKEDADKRFLIDVLYRALAEVTNDTDIQITNPERQIDFEQNDRKFRIVLSAPRS